jgi:hypothetical protein
VEALGFGVASGIKLPFFDFLKMALLWGSERIKSKSIDLKKAMAVSNETSECIKDPS